MEKLIRVALIGALAVGASAETRWRGGDGNWSDPTKWNGGLPSESNGAVFPDGTYTVNIDGHYKALTLTASASSSGSVLTFTGSGSVSNVTGQGTSSRMTLYSGRTIIVDGPYLWPYYFANYGKFKVIGDTVFEPRKFNFLSASAGLAVHGGTCSIPECAFPSGSSFLITDGSVTFTKPAVSNAASFRIVGGVVGFDGSSHPVMEEGVDFEFSGGTIRYINGTSSSYDTDLSSRTWLLPGKYGTTIFPSARASAAWFKVPGTYPMAGSVMPTNGTFHLETGGGTVCTFTGGATVVAQTLRLTGNSAVVTSDWRRVVLGRGGMCLSYKSTWTFSGATFGAFGDWFNYPGAEGNRYSVTLRDDVAFDTLDYFDQSTPRSITLTNISAQAVTSLSAYGGGSAKLAFNTSPGRLDRLSVGSGTTMVLTNYSAKLPADVLEMGDGSVIDMKVGSFIEAASAAIAPTARIRVTPPATLTAGTQYPVFYAPVGMENPLSCVTLTDALPEGWKMDAIGSYVCITDGTAVAGSPSATHQAEPNKYVYWNGTLDDKWSTGGNWSSGTVPNASSLYVYFSGNGNGHQVITNETSAIQFRSIHVNADAAPYEIRGASMRFLYPTSAAGSNHSILSESSHPFTMRNYVYKKNSDGGMILLATGSSYIALTGGGTVPETLQFNGDIRLGGTWTAQQFVAQDATAPTRGRRLTVLPGGSLTVSAQETSLTSASTVSVLGGATMSVAGTALDYAASSANVVDGTLTVTCPISCAGGVAFRGTGVVEVASFAGATETPGNVSLAGKVRFTPHEWSAPVGLKVRDTPILAAADDLALDFQGEAIDLDMHATLTVDTGAHTVSVAAPFTGGGDIAKQGEGRLTIASTNVLNGAVSVAAGTLDLAAPQTFRRLSFAEGASLTVSGALMDDAMRGRTLLFVAKECAAFPALSNAWRVVAERSEDGTLTVYARRNVGMRVVIR